MTNAQNTHKPIVLYVDDERNNLLSFKAAFRLDFNVLMANSPEEALDILSKEEVHVIISDFRMPTMTGVELFEKIRYEYPRPLRILLTAYGDVQNLSDAINRGQVYRYIKKPWAEDDIRFAVKEAFDFYTTKNSLEQKNKELIEAYRDLDRFVYSVSHDLRSPLMGILATTNLLNRDSNIDDIDGLVLLVQKNIHRLDEFIVNLLEYYRVKRGELSIKNVDFNALFEQIIGIYTADLKSRGISIEVNVDQREEFRSDPMVLTIAIQNIISNAIKYQREDNDKKFIKIKAVVFDCFANIKIEDNGIGIESVYLDRIYEMFFRASSQEFGSGIGLYNAKNAMDKIGAEIKASSVVNEGTLFELIIPSK
ncbi:MAG: hybrid sensor histidine kinase/response regulator [Bacteroidota bacterium]|nr:hybrid sensor histidine kinase/response regulator [Bacteroidota bacterium]